MYVKCFFLTWLINSNINAVASMWKKRVNGTLISYSFRLFCLFFFCNYGPFEFMSLKYFRGEMSLKELLRTHVKHNKWHHVDTVSCESKSLRDPGLIINYCTEQAYHLLNVKATFKNKYTNCLIVRKGVRSHEGESVVPSSMSRVMESRITVSCPADALARLAIDWLCPSALIHHVIFV